MILYAETSAIMKLLVEEDGSEIAGELWEAADRIATGAVTYAEARAALASAARSRRIRGPDHGRAKSGLLRLLADAYVVWLTESIVRAAGDFAEKHALRGYDAIHLASAVVLDADDLILASWDRDLLKAARAVGLQTAGA